MDITITADLWASSMLPEGLVKRWFVADKAAVKAGNRIAEVVIEDALHEIVAPASGRLTIAAATCAIVEPGSVLGSIDPIL